MEVVSVSSFPYCRVVASIPWRVTTNLYTSPARNKESLQLTVWFTFVLWSLRAIWSPQKSGRVLSVSPSMIFTEVLLSARFGSHGGDRIVIVTCPSSNTSSQTPWQLRDPGVRDLDMDRWPLYIRKDGGWG